MNISILNYIYRIYYQSFFSNNIFYKYIAEKKYRKIKIKKTAEKNEIKFNIIKYNFDIIYPIPSVIILIKNIIKNKKIKIYRFGFKDFARCIGILISYKLLNFSKSKI